MVSLLAKQEFAVPRVVARVNHPENEWLFDETLGVDISVSTPHLLTAVVEEAVSIGVAGPAAELRRRAGRPGRGQAGLGLAGRAAGRSSISGCPGAPRSSPSCGPSRSSCPGGHEAGARRRGPGPGDPRERGRGPPTPAVGQTPLLPTCPPTRPSKSPRELLRSRHRSLPPRVDLPERLLPDQEPPARPTARTPTG